MPFLTVGFLVGTLVTKTVRQLVEHYLAPEEREGDRDEKTTSVPTDASPRTTADPGSVTVINTAAAIEEINGNVAEHTPRTYLSSDRCQSVCKFTNLFNNCWMNASLQAALHLKVVQEKLAHLPPESLTALSPTPAFAELFLTALNNPGKTFTSGEIFGVLSELSKKVPSLRLFQNNDLYDLMDLLLCWLNQCGVQTAIQVNEVSRCEQCKFATSSTSTLGSMYFLPLLGKHANTIFSLLMHDIHQIRGPGQCEACGSTVQTEQAWICPDVLALYLSRAAANDSILREPVIPSEMIEIPVDENRSQRYRLSSVICHCGWHIATGHFWSYLFDDGVTIKANDCQISVSPEARPADIYQSGIIYIYEKCT